MTDLYLSNQNPHGLVAALENPPLDYVLKASLDTSISDRALRLVAGLAPLLAERAEDRPGKRTHVPLHTIESVTGLDLTRPIDDLLAEVEQRIGLVRQISKGQPGVVETNRLGVRHGIAGAWGLTEPLVQPARFNGHRQAWRLLNPQDARWSRQHRAWRLCTALVATYGLGRASLATGEIARLLGCSKPNAIRIREALLKVLNLPSSFRHVDLGEAASYAQQDLGDFNVGMRHLLHRDKFLAEDVEEEAKPEPEVVPEPEPLTDEDRALIADYRARLTGPVKTRSTAGKV